MFAELNKREIASEIVAEQARYMEDSPVNKYQIRLGSKLFISHCTHDLADQVADAFAIQRLNELRKSVMADRKPKGVTASCYTCDRIVPLPTDLIRGPDTEFRCTKCHKKAYPNLTSESDADNPFRRDIEPFEKGPK